jgi:hypothetical protein
MHYISFLEAVHRALQPRSYLEIGVSRGRSLGLARCRAVGVDPLFSIDHPIDGDVALVRSTSDEFFARPDPLSLTRGQPFDLTFIDGLHLLEFALRDLINTERCSGPASLIVIDDVLPRSVDEAARERHTGPWTGDVFPLLDILPSYRPDLVVLPVDTRPTGLLLVLGIDPDSRTLATRFGEILERFRRPDPQAVPEDVLDRRTALPPRRVLESGVLDLLRDGRGLTGGELHAEVAERVRASLGPAWV